MSLSYRLDYSQAQTAPPHSGGFRRAVIFVEYLLLFSCGNADACICNRYYNEIAVGPLYALRFQGNIPAGGGAAE